MLRARRAVGWVLAMSLTGCGPTEPEIADQLVGDWLWLDATGGIAGVDADSRPARGTTRVCASTSLGKWSCFRDGVSQARTDFTYFVGPDGGSDNIGYGQGLFGFPSSGVELIPGDTLLLIDPCCDGFVRRWVR